MNPKVEFILPEYLWSHPSPDAVYEFVVGMTFASGKLYEPGDQLRLHHMTDESPFGSCSKLGNWIVSCKHFSPPEPESVWSGVWAMIDQGIIRRVK